MECRICFKNFGPGYTPIVIECGHTICSKCLDLLYKSNYKCPFDLRKLKIPPIKLSPNYELLELIPKPQPSIDLKVWGLIFTLILLLLLLIYKQSTFF